MQVTTKKRLTTAAMFTVLAAIALLQGGCASVFNPYESKATCPDFPLGKCAPMAQAYKESLAPTSSSQQGATSAKPDCPDCVKKAAGEATASPSTGNMTAQEQAELGFQTTLYKKYTKMLNEPVAPILVPPQVIRVLLLPYEGDGKELFTSRYAYIRIKDASWIFGEQNLPND